MNPKKNVALHAATLIQPGMILGLGSGSTAAYFIEHLGLLCRQGLNIQGVATSKNSEQLARRHGVPLIDLDDAPHIDLDIDGADEIDPQKRLIKGRGGAHVREKIVASASRELLIIADASKLVPALRGPLPVEILPFGLKTTLRHLTALGYSGALRNTGPTDNGNILYDIHFDAPLLSPETVHETLRAIPGVVDTGFFFHLAGRILIGQQDGTIKVL